MLCVTVSSLEDIGKTFVVVNVHVSFVYLLNEWCWKPYSFCLLIVLLGLLI